MKRIGLFVAAMVFGLLIGIGATVAASSKGVTRGVREGPVAAVAVATSADGQIVYVVNTDGFFKSTDAGVTFVELHD